MEPKSKRRGTARDGSRFVALPYVVLDCPAWSALSFSARALLVDLARQYSGANNGRLTICDKALRPRGWKSSTTIHKAKAELLAAGFVCTTRQGCKPNRTSWFALTWHALDWVPEMDMARAGFVRSAYLQK